MPAPPLATTPYPVVPVVRQTLRGKQPFAELTKLAWLDHYWGDDKSPRSAKRLDPLGDAGLTNPGFWTANGVKLSERLQDLFNDRIKELFRLKPGYVRRTGLQFGVVDLTRDKNKPEFAGHKPIEHWEAASTAKLALMYAAFQLEFDLNVMAAMNPQLTTERSLFDFARREWGKTQVDGAPKVVIPTPGNKPKLEVHGRLILVNGKPIGAPRYPAPRLENIFTVAGGPGGALEVKFKRHKDRLKDEEIREIVHTPHVVHGAVADLTFYECLYVMVKFSTNEAANALLKNLGFLYIHSALWQSGLYSPERGGGFWVGRTFPNGDIWRPAPVPYPVPRTPDGQQIWASLSVAAATGLMTLIAQDRLVSPGACARMREMMNWSGSDTRVGLPFSDALRSFRDRFDAVYSKIGIVEDPVGSLDSTGLRLDEVYSKIGIGGRRNYWDVGYLVRNSGANTLRYAAACLDSVHQEKESDPGHGPLTDIIVALDDCVKQNNR